MPRTILLRAWLGRQLPGQRSDRDLRIEPASASHHISGGFPCNSTLIFSGCWFFRLNPIP